MVIDFLTYEIPLYKAIIIFVAILLFFRHCKGWIEECRRGESLGVNNNDPIWYYPPVGRCTARNYEEMQRCDLFSPEPLSREQCVYLDKNGKCHSKGFTYNIEREFGENDGRD